MATIDRSYAVDYPLIGGWRIQPASAVSAVTHFSRLPVSRRGGHACRTYFIQPKPSAEGAHRSWLDRQHRGRGWPGRAGVGRRDCECHLGFAVVEIM